ncbi:MAG TPA: triple tyrosine motif-containing protein, partial [Arachidicoccus sp.]
TVKVFDNKIFIGTSDGLYSSPLMLPQTEDLSFSKGDFSKIGNSGGQVWDLFNEHNQLLMGHTDGAFIIQNNTAVPIFKGAGTWLFRDLPDNKKNDINILTGTYYGLHLIKNIHGQIVDSGKVKNSIYESLRFIEIDTMHHIIWSAHPYRGIYKITMRADMREVISSKLYTQKDGLPTTLNNYVYSLHHQIVFCTDSGLYTYNASSDRFEKDPQYKNIFGNMSLRIVVPDDSDNIWFVSQKNLGVVLKNGRIRYFPEVAGKLIAGFESIYPLNQQNIFVGSTDGLIHINFEKYSQKHNGLQLLFNKITATGKKDALLFNGYFTTGDSIYETQHKNNVIALPASFNSIHFEYTSTEYAQHNNIQYSFQLAGFDRNWSSWSIRNEKDYTNLPYGKYIFKVKARNNFNDTSEIAEYTFIIRPHWYQTNLAYFLYGISILLLLFRFRKYQLGKFEKQRLKYEDEQQKLQYLHQLEREHNEREIINLQKEKLESEVSFKNKELASTTMHLYKRGKLLSRLKEDLSQVAKNIPEEDSRKEVIKLVRMLNEEEKSANDWEQFSIHFDDVHNNFLSNLKKSYPDLTQADLKICAYIKMNLSSKEMAQLLNI